MEEDFFNKALDELRVIETEDGEKWVNLDDLIISIHFQSESLKMEKEEEIPYQDFSDLEKDFSEYQSALSDIINSLEQIHEEFNGQEDNA